MPDTKFKKGIPSWNKGMDNPWMKGKPRSEETKIRISNTRKSLGLKPSPYPRNENVIKTCISCKYKFEVVNSRKDKAFFCSRKCCHEHKRGTIPYNKGVFKSNTYGAHHDKVRKLRGKPSKCEICGTTEAKRFEWANITGNYEDINDYKRMCKSCHNRHDGVINNITKKK